MYSDADSDDDYRYEADIYCTRRGSSYLRVLDEELYITKDATYLMRRDLELTMRNTASKQSDKEFLRGVLASPQLGPWQDWRRIRVQRVFEEIKGFHNGSLDLSGRSPARYKKVASRFFPLMEDMRSLGPFIVQVPIEVAPWDLSRRRHVIQTVSMPAVGNKDVWESFKLRWKIPPTVIFVDLHKWGAETLEVLTRYPTPVYQNLYITQLPPELLTVMFTCANVDDARRLSSTCKYLRQIGAQHAFSSRRLLMECHESKMGKLTDACNPAEVADEVRKTMLKYRESCTSEAQFIISRPDICACISNLVIGSRWMKGLFRQRVVAEAVPEPTDEVMFGPLVKQYAALLRSVRLQELDIMHIAFDEELFSEIASQPLSSAKFSYCRVPVALQQRIQANPLHSSIKKLTILFRPGDTEDEDAAVHSIWYILAACSALRVLHFCNIAPASTLLPPAHALWPLLTCLNTLERVHLDGIDCDISEFTGMFSLAASRGPLRLTHLKLHSAWYIEDVALAEFLRTLHAGQAPLRVLSVDGVYPVSPDLVSGIASLFPGLEALTLIRRDGANQHQARMCRWPRPLYEYAGCMRAFTRLRIFAANFHYDKFELSPVWMCGLEDGHKKSTRNPDGEDISDSRAFVLPFATYCPSLEWFYIIPSKPLYEVKIRRLPDGTIELIGTSPSTDRVPFDTWNPVEIDSSFPLP